MKVFILTGAGISAESGLGTFRDKDGHWVQFDLDEVATPAGFRRNPAKVHAFYNLRRRTALAAVPNPAHEALARLARDGAPLGIEVFLCTQNVDDLHERAGSDGVVHMHGSLFEARCVRCRATMHWRGDMDAATACPACGVSGGMRPGVVWFGEKPLHMDAIEAAVRDGALRRDRHLGHGVSGGWVRSRCLSTGSAHHRAQPGARSEQLIH